MFCSGCGSNIDETQNFCPKCGRASGTSYSLGTSAAAAPIAAVQQVIVIKTAKSPGIAAVLSFFWAGLGQIYNGEIGKGIGLIIAHFISLLLMFVIIGFITTPILWIYGMVDAYQTAEKINAAAGIR